MFYKKIPKQPKKFLSIKQIKILKKILNHTLNSITFTQYILTQFLKQTSSKHNPNKKK